MDNNLTELEKFKHAMGTLMQVFNIDDDEKINQPQITNTDIMKMKMSFAKVVKHMVMAQRTLSKIEQDGNVTESGMRKLNQFSDQTVNMIIENFQYLIEGKISL